MRIEWVRPDWATLGAVWRDLEARADGSFFQSWTWVGCEAPSRLREPWLLRAVEADRVVGLALFNRTGPRLAPSLRLHETGEAAADSVFIEHNGPLLARDHQALLRPMLGAALRRGRVILSGVGETILTQARTLGSCRIVASRPSPFAVLNGGDAAAWLGSLGAATRYHLRRSRRAYEATGRLSVRRAATVEEGLDFLDSLARLHQTTWIARGRPGAFAEPAFRTFHRALVARGLPRGEVELLRIATETSKGTQIIGYLYNFRYNDVISTYQSGFDYAGAGRHQAPGLTCHLAAIEAGIDSGARVYDFLAGAARYKTSLASAETRLHWIQVANRLSPYGLMHLAQNKLGSR